MYLSGNFGEIRSDHFHSGIDIKTRGSIGHPVFSIEDGYVSRLKVQANGYGKSIYVTHPSGYTSVYGHLDRYRDDIAGYVKSMQYKLRSHEVDLYLKEDQFRLSKGEMIAYSGNSGSSSGPHLHFEVRTAADQHPTNVLKYNFDIEDLVAPRFLTLFITPLDPESHVNGSKERFSKGIVRDGQQYAIPYGTRLSASGRLGVSVEVFDYLNGASNRCGIYTLEMYVDDKLTYSHVMDEFSFSETRYVNAHVDYKALINSGIRAHRLHRLPNNRLRIYDHLEQDGVLEVIEDRVHRIRIVASDVAGNRSELVFNVSGDTAVLPAGNADPGVTRRMKYNEPNHYTVDEVSVEIPANALYADMDFTFGKSPGIPGSWSDLYHIASTEIPLHLPYTLTIETAETDPQLQGKLLLITMDEDDEVIAAGGEYRNGAVVASLRSFGDFAVAMDTTAPEIVPLQRTTGDLTGRNTLRFTILDDLSGIDHYEGYIDNKWVLFEYDLKNDLLNYTFDSGHITSGTDHELELYVTDEKGNVNLYHARFKW